ncbi:hypothetical protein LOK74_14310 [Brevibacillus humidisoli]|uniref:hypothetical protein n=1 Tax=Brevibacillus humidisoli TaxID=2895522 RepID=UPI001E2CC66C|nr:hypothetical protein [Brevibacillus humidisoli]UFJ39243.1 hypothetical protein LOK74_14310 [Brevibacillus humidisoli]
MRKLVRGPIWAGMFAFLILFMNFLPLVAFAEVNLEAPKYQVPELNNPEWEVPEMEPPNWDTPDLQAPEWDAPDLQAPEWDRPELNVPKSDVPQLQVPDLDVPGLEAPGSQIPGLEVPNAQSPDLEIPQTGIPTLGNPNPQQPESLVPELNQPGLDQPNASERKGPTALDALKSTTGILNHTVVFVEELSAPDFDQSTLKGKVLNLKGRQFLEIYKLGSKGNEAFEFSADLADAGLKVYDAFDARRYFQDARNAVETNYRRFGQGTNNLKPWFSKSSNLNLDVPKANPYLGAVGLGLSLSEFANNKLAYENAKNDQEKTDAVIGMVGNVGDSMTNVGMMISRVPIPAVQAVAGGLIVVGTVLSVGSMVAKWANSKTGRKVIKGTVDAVKKGFNKVKSWFGF